MVIFVFCLPVALIPFSPPCFQHSRSLEAPIASPRSPRTSSIACLPIPWRWHHSPSPFAVSPRSTPAFPPAQDPSQWHLQYLLYTRRPCSNLHSYPDRSISEPSVVWGWLSGSCLQPVPSSLAQQGRILVGDSWSRWLHWFGSSWASCPQEGLTASACSRPSLRRGC